MHNLRLLSRPLTKTQVKVYFQDHQPKVAKMDNNLTPFKTPGSKSEEMVCSFKTTEDGSQKLTPFKTLKKRVKRLNPRYMVPVNEVSQVISDPQTAEMAQPVKDQPLSGPPPKGSRFNPIYMEPGSTSINSTRDLQALFSNSLDCLGDMSGEYDIKTDPTWSPSSTTWKMESSHQVQGGDRERAGRDGISRNHQETDWAHTMGQLSHIPQEGKWQVEDMPWPKGLGTKPSSMRITRHQPSRR